MIHPSGSWEPVARFKSGIHDGGTHLWWCEPSRTAESWEWSRSSGCNKKNKQYRLICVSKY